MNGVILSVWYRFIMDIIVHTLLMKSAACNGSSCENFLWLNATWYYLFENFFFFLMPNFSIIYLDVYGSIIKSGFWKTSVLLMRKGILFRSVLDIDNISFHKWAIAIYSANILYWNALVNICFRFTYFVTRCLSWIKWYKLSQREGRSKSFHTFLV